MLFSREDWEYSEYPGWISISGPRPRCSRSTREYGGGRPSARFYDDEQPGFWWYGQGTYNVFLINSV